jgi:hypothetical protein
VPGKWARQAKPQRTVQIGVCLGASMRKVPSGLALGNVASHPARIPRGVNPPIAASAPSPSLAARATRQPCACTDWTPSLRSEPATPRTRSSSTGSTGPHPRSRPTLNCENTSQHALGFGCSPPADIYPSGSGVAHVSPTRPALQPMAITTRPGWCPRRSWCSWLCAPVPAPRLTRPVQQDVKLAFVAPAATHDCAGNGSF